MRNRTLPGKNAISGKSGVIIFILLAILLLIPWAYWHGLMKGSESNGGHAELELIIGQDRGIYEINDTITLSVKLLNKGSGAIDIEDPSLEYGNLDVHIRLPDSSVLSYMGPWINCIPQIITLGPGEAVNLTYNLNEYYIKNGIKYMRYSFGNTSLNISGFGFNIPGNYSIWATYDSRYNNVSISLRSNTVQFRIVDDMMTRHTMCVERDSSDHHSGW